MDDVTQARLRTLAEVDTDLCISLYVPLNAEYPQVRANVRVVAALLDQAEEVLRGEGLLGG